MAKAHFRQCRRNFKSRCARFANLKETHRWPLAPCKSPSGLAADLKTRRLLAVCDDKVSAVVDADSGKVVATPAICDGPDAAAFDPSSNYFFASCGDGNLTISTKIPPTSTPSSRMCPQKRLLAPWARPKNHKIFLPTAEFEPQLPASAAANEARHLRHPSSRQVILSAAVLLPLSRRRPQASGTRIELASAVTLSQASVRKQQQSPRHVKKQKRPVRISRKKTVFLRLTRRLAGPPV